MPFSAFRTTGQGAVAKGPLTVLVVDDEKVIRELCQAALKDYRVLQAGSSADALQVYSTESCDLVLTDVMMPGGSGIDLLREIKQRDLNAVVIIMTGFGDKEIILNALKEGADDFINKPLSLLQLRTSVERSLIRKKLKEELAALKQLDRLKSGFLSLVSHKLRTPLTSLSLFVQNVKMGALEKDDEVFDQSIDLMQRELERLSAMVADLISFSQVMDAERELHRVPCDLNRIVAESIVQSREAPLKQQCTVDFKEGEIPSMNLDMVKISFAIQQIIENAFKFAPDHAQLRVSSFVAEDGSTVFLRVADNGSGIPGDALEKVCDKFYQYDPFNTGQVRGFGLGLYFAHDFVGLHGGSLLLESDPGVGTVVTVSLPVQ